MVQYTVTGMSCAACSARVEKAVSSVPGVTSCSVSLLTNSMGVEGTASAESVIQAVTKAGYSAALKTVPRAGGQVLLSSTQGAARSAIDEESLMDRETPVLRRRLLASLGFLLVLMYVSMGHMMWNWPIPAWFQNNHVAIGLFELLLAAAVMIINQKFFINGVKGLLHRAPNMDTLVALGSLSSFFWSVVVLFWMIQAQANGDSEAVMSYAMELYFESAAMILTLITVGKMLEARSKGKTTDALKGLMKLSPKTAVVLRGKSKNEATDSTTSAEPAVQTGSGSEEGCREVIVPVEQVRRGDIFVVRPGESIPVDGVVLDGNSAVNEAALTGESIPVDKAPGDAVSAATINQSGFLTCEATRVGEDTTLSQIIQMVSDAAATKAPIAKIADRVSGVFVPVVITIACLTTLIWLLAGVRFGFALARGISVLVISCPCALGLATPVAILVGNGLGAKNGILFKTAASLEEAGKVSVVVFDKTGTITKGEPKVTELLPAKGVTREELLYYAYMLEKKSEHPLAWAIRNEWEERGRLPGKAIGKPACNSDTEVTDFQALPGNGLRGMLGGELLLGGSLRFVLEQSKNGSCDKQAVEAKANALAESGKTPLLFAKNGSLLGLIAVADVIKEDSPKAIQELQDMGIRVIMLTGDQERTAKAIGAQVGVDEVIAGVLPDGKEAVIRRLQESDGTKKKKVAMVGDGINDAPALTRADIGIAIGAGTDIAMDAADVVLMKSSLNDVPAAIRLSRATLKNIRQNLFWAFFYNVIGIPLAAGLWIPIFGWTLQPMFGAAAMSLSSFCVVSNALRLKLFPLYEEPYDAKKPNAQSQIENDRETKEEESATEYTKIETKEEKKMVKTVMQVEGMMCGHCEAHVNKAIANAFEVKEVVSSHEKNTTEILSEQPLDEAKLRATVEGLDYKVGAITVEIA